MKKLFFTFLCLSLTAIFAADCASKAASPFNRSGFLEQKNVRTVAPVNEICEYSVSYEKDEKSGYNVDFNVDNETSRLKTSLSVYLSDGSVGESGKSYYLFETDLVINGECSINGDKTAFSDSVKTKVYFEGTGAALKPVQSFRSAKTSALEGDSNDLKLVRYDYDYTVSYDDNNAYVTVTPNDTDQKYAAQGEYTLENVFDGNYIDNELMLFAPRAMSLDNLLTSFKTVDALAKTAHDMKLTYKENGNITFAAKSSVLSENGALFYRTSPKVSTLSLEVNSSYSGAAHVLSFAAESEDHEYQRLIKAEYPATFGVGKFVFLISSSEISF